MPGPLSAPNGDARLTKMTGTERVRLAEQHKLDTGKTKQKRGDLNDAAIRQH